MGDTDHGHDAAPVTETVHDNSWSANLEQPQHAEDPEIVISQAVDAIEHTTAGNHVNLVTHGDLGHPESYLYDALSERVDGVDLEYVEQCGCGGYVVRAHVREA
jgi:putative CGCGG family rSAM target protein